jgi:cytochrome c5
MRTLFFIFLMTLLPLQFSWSAASEYCQHEDTAKAAQHFGHHVHVHHADAQDKNPSSKHNKMVHHDCSFCHVSHVVAAVPLFDSSSFQSRINDSALNPFDPPLAYKSYISKGIDRPDWRFAA